MTQGTAPAGHIIATRLAAAFLAMAAVSVPGCSTNREAGAPEPYNVLLVTLDTTRADHLGCYGYPLDTSPNLDALADDAVRFDLAISTSAITPISHASIFTGLNPDRHGLRVFYGPVGHVLDRSHPTLASVLQARGWETAAFISAFPASERFGLDHGFRTFRAGIAREVMERDPRLRPPKDGSWLRQRTASAQRRADATTDEVLEWFQDSDGDRPFFLWVHYFDPHDTSLVPPREITDRFGVTSGDVDAVKAVYDPEIHFMDGQFGRLVRHLEREGLYDRTILVVVGDHGQGLGDHGWFPHRLLYQEQVRVPLIVRIPGARRGVVIPDLVRTIDLLPTVLTALGIETPPRVQGRSILELLAGDPEEPRIALAEALNTLDAHAPRALPTHQRDLLFCAMDRDWKLIHHARTPANDELYHLAVDPGESSNLARTHPDQARRLLNALKSSGIMKIRIEEPAGPRDPSELEKLRSLGYVD